MLHSTLSALLVSVASRYAQLSPSDVGIGIDGGRLVIDNVQLRAHTFNGPKIPFHVHEGRAGRLRVNVPWSALSSTPVKVYLENVHLIAGPKQHYVDQPNKRTTEVSSPQGEWHQTIVGRLLFNVSVEIYGLKVEYRDDECVGIISIASLRATSAGPDWNQRFVSLSSDLDPEQPQASVVSMRKLVQLSGVHWVMIPRTKGAPPAAEGLTVTEQGRSPRFSERHLDLNSYESKAPILDGIAVTVRVLMCTGMALVGASVSPGLHAEIDVDIEETSVSLTAQQIKWIDQILQKGFGVSKTQHSNHVKQSIKQKTKRRPRTSVASEESLHDEASYPGAVTFASDIPHEDESGSVKSASENLHHDNQNEDSDQEDVKPSSGNRTTPKADGGSESDMRGEENGNMQPNEETKLIQADSEEKSSSDQDDDQPHSGEDAVGGFGYFWHALVGEYADETVDDAAFALGLANGYFANSDEDHQQGEQREHDADVQYARAAVNAAAMAGGRTFKLRLKTPDMETRDEIDALRVELERETEKRLELQNIEDELYEAENRIKEHENEIEALRNRNASLVQELEELEAMTSQSGKNKDAMIRQMEAALMKAEKNLQAMYQAKHEQQESDARAIQTETKAIQPSQDPGISKVESASSAVADDTTEVEDNIDGEVGGMEESPGVAQFEDRVDSESSTAEHVNGDAEAKAVPGVHREPVSANAEELHTVETSSPEHVDDSNFEESNSDISEPGIGDLSSGDHRLTSDSFGINAKNIEQAMSSEGLTLV